MQKAKFSFLLLLLFIPLSLLPTRGQVQSVGLTLNQPLGSTMTFIVNSSAKEIQVDWGNRLQQTYSLENHGALSEIRGEIQGKSIRIYGKSEWTLLQCDNHHISDIDLSKASLLHSLYIQNNELDSLDLRGMKAMVDLNGAGNKIGKLVFTDFRFPQLDLLSIENIDLSHNGISGCFKCPFPKIQHLNISHNAITAIQMRIPPGVLLLQVPSRQNVCIHDIDGRLFLKQTLEKGTSAIKMAKGIYVVNSKRIQIR